MHQMTFRTVLPITCLLGLILWPGNIFANDQPTSANPDLTAKIGVRVPPEIQKWMDRTTSLSAIPSGSYPASRLLDYLPPHAPELLETDETGGTPLALEVADPQVFDVPVSERVHQLKPNGELDDTRECGRKLPFPALREDAPRAGLKAIWNLLCRNRGGGTFEYLAHGLRGSGPDPHRTYIINGRKGYGRHGIGLRMLFLAPGDQKDNEMMGWLPLARNQDESIYMYNMQMRRARRGSTNRADKMIGTFLKREQEWGWEAPYHVYNWQLLGTRPVLTVLNSQRTFPRYLSPHHWFPDDRWLVRSAFVVVGQRAHPGAGSEHVAIWLDNATFEPLWVVSYTVEGIAQDILGLIFKWNSKYRRHVVIGKSSVGFNDAGLPIGGTTLEARWCSIVHHPEEIPTPGMFNGQLLGKTPFKWSKRPEDCPDSTLRLDD